MAVTHHAAVVARDLESVFSVARMRRAWRRAVRTGLRRQPLADLHDFLDVHRNLKPYLRALRTEVLSGQYRPLPPEITLLEKRDGIPRRLCLPAPADAILLQTLVNGLEPVISTRQPHPNAYYSQSHAPPTVEDVDGTFAYPWWTLWPQFQERIWGFTRTHDYIVVTDLANYFDCIPLSALRNRISSFGAFNRNGFELPVLSTRCVHMASVLHASIRGWPSPTELRRPPATCSRLSLSDRRRAASRHRRGLCSLDGRHQLWRG